MPETAKLTTNNFVGPGLNWLEPHWNKRPGDRVSRDAHMRQVEIVDYVLRGQFDNDRAIHRHVELAQHDNVILAGWIIGIDPERIRIRHQVNVALPKLAIRSGHVKRPVELLPNNVNKDCVTSRRKFVHSLCPKGNGKSDEQDGFDEHAGKF